MGDVAGIPLVGGTANLFFQLLAGQGAPGGYRQVAIFAGLALYAGCAAAIVAAFRSRESRPVRSDIHAALLMAAPIGLTAVLALLAGNSHLLVAMRYSILALAGLSLILGSVCVRARPLYGALLTAALIVLSVNYLLA
jgi:hypothetical protein